MQEKGKYYKKKTPVATEVIVVGVCVRAKDYRKLELLELIHFKGMMQITENVLFHLYL